MTCAESVRGLEDATYEVSFSGGHCPKTWWKLEDMKMEDTMATYTEYVRESIEAGVASTRRATNYRWRVVQDLLEHFPDCVLECDRALWTGIRVLLTHNGALLNADGKTSPPPQLAHP